MFKTSKRLVAMLICLAMVLAMLPMAVFAAGTTTLYCVAPDWSNCNVYWWGSSDTNPSWPGKAMTQGADGVWYYEVPSDAGNVIFNNGSAKTADLTMPTDENVQYTIGGGWSTYGSVVEVEVLTVYVNAPASWGTPNVYLWNGSVSNGWPGAAMTQVDGTIYKYDVPVANGYTSLIFNGSGGQTADLTMPTTENAMYIVSTSTWSTYTTECTHANVTELPAEAATCIYAGKTAGSVCADCGETIVAQEEVAALGHTCDEGETCERCGKALDYINVYFQNNWMWTDVCAYYWGSAIAVDCTWPGVAAELYGNDGTYDIYVAKIPADVDGLIFNGYDAGNEATNQTPDITDMAEDICYYMIWDETESKNAVGSESIDVILPPACEHEYTYECDTVCNKCYEETREASHSIVHVAAKAGTDCQTWDGNVEYWYCEYCGCCWLDEALTRVTNRMSIAATGDHEYMYDCDTVCCNCYEETREASHTINHVDAKAGTDCQTWDGNVEYWYCSDCGSCWLDEALTRVTNRMSIAAVGEHNYVRNVCTACGEHEYDVQLQYKTTDGVSAIRLVSYVDDLSAYSKVSFNVTIGGNSTTWDCNVAYDALVAGSGTFSASDIFGEDAEYFVMYTFGGITEEYYELDMTISVTWTDLEGNETTSDTRTVNVGDLLG